MSKLSGTVVMNFKKHLVIITFFTNLFIRFGIFLLIGIVLCLIGTKYRVALIIGAALVAFDLVASVYDTMIVMHGFKHGTHPAIEDIRNAVESDDSENALSETIVQFTNDPDLMLARTGKYLLEEKLNEDSTAEDIVAAYEDMCAKEDCPDLVFECMCQGDKFFMYFTRDYPNKDGEYYQLRTSLSFDKPSHGLMELILLSGNKEEFFESVRRSEGYLYATSNKGSDLKIYILSTS